MSLRQSTNSQRCLAPVAQLKYNERIASTAIKGFRKREQIVSQVKQWIDERRLAPGSRLGSQNELAAYFGVTAVTVHKAMRQLEQEFVVYREHGRGTFVGRAPHTTRIMTVCLILPGEHLAEPAFNPEYWPYIKSLYKAFLTGVGDRWSFTTRVVTPGADIRPVVKELSRFDAVVFHHVKEPLDLLEHLVKKRVVPTAALGLPKCGVNCLTVDHDMVAGSRMAIRYLHAMGYRHVAMVRTREPWADLWLEGYRQGLADVGQPFDQRLVVQVDYSRDAAFSAAAELLTRGVSFDAVYADSDVRALGVYEGLRHAGVRVPEDVGVMGYDGFEYITQQPPYLTSVRQPLDQMVTTILAAVEESPGSATENRHIKITGTIVPGRTAVARCPDADEAKQLIESEAAKTF